MRHPFLSTIIIFESSFPKRKSAAGKICKNFGFQTIGRNFYIGKLKKYEIEKIKVQLERTFSSSKDKFFIIPVCQKCHKNVIINYIKQPMVEEKEFIIFD